MEVKFENVSKMFFGQWALDDISLLIEPGTLVAVIGVNGAGKSTFLRCLATLLNPTRGEIYLDSQPLERSNIALRKRLHFLPDDPICFEHFDLVSQIVFALEAYDYLPSGIESKISRLIHEFSLDSCEYKTMSMLSRGQRFKAALVALVSLELDLWLVDEPFASGMDPMGIHLFRKYAREATSRGTTVIYSTQIVEIAENFADKVVVLNDGQLLAFGSLNEIRTQMAQNLGTVSSLADVFSKLSDQRE